MFLQQIEISNHFVAMSDFDGLCSNADDLLQESFSVDNAFEAEFPLSDSVVCLHILILIY